MAMTCAIMQPTFLPWAGYFNLIASVDCFVLLDDVQFERKSWQCRNRILLGGITKVLEVPVTKQPLSEKIKSIVIDDSTDWRSAHLQALTEAYAATATGRRMVDAVGAVLLKPNELLVDLNCALIQRLATILGLMTPMVRASTLNCGGKRSEHLVEILNVLKADRYLSPVGSKNYLEQDEFAEKSEAELVYQQFNPAPYSQVDNSAFVSHLSIVDVIANCSMERARDYVLGTTNAC